MTALRGLVLPAGLLLTLIACASTAPRARAPAGAPVSAEAAASLIAAARCEHEAICNQVGAGRDYATPDACATELAGSALAELKANPCRSGIDSTQVSACANRFRRETCHPLSTLSRMYACRPATLCVRTGEVKLSEEDIYGVDD